MDFKVKNAVLDTFRLEPRVQMLPPGLVEVLTPFVIRLPDTLFEELENRVCIPELVRCWRLFIQDCESHGFAKRLRQAHISEANKIQPELRKLYKQINRSYQFVIDYYYDHPDQDMRTMFCPSVNLDPDLRSEYRARTLTVWKLLNKQPSLIVYICLGSQP